MYVCLCKGITCGAIRSAVHEHGMANLRDLSKNLGVATQCGKCAHSARQVLQDVLGGGAAGACATRDDVAA